MKYFLLVLFFSGVTMVSAQNISQDKLKQHIGYLADDKLEGRGSGTPSELKAAKYIAKQFKKIGLAPMGTKGYMHEFTFRKSANPHGAEDPAAAPIGSRNVVGFLDNGAENTIVIGAHYDHLGLGHDGNSLDANPHDKIHNGADDNASGTAGVIELARHYQANKMKEKTNFLFICFSGEELGLYGSKKYCESPTIDLKKVQAMINLDMIGRLKEDKTLLVGGVGTAPELVDIVQGLKDPLKVNVDSAGIGPSDHTSFYLKDIPVLFFFTGQHSDYHKPSDDIERVNWAGEQQVLDYVIRVTDRISGMPKLKFTPTKSKTSDTPAFKVTLGVMPDYVFDGTGLRLDGVTDDKPAAKAGLKTGDIIVQLGSFPINNIQDYMQALSKFKKGETTKVKVKRGQEEKEMEVTF
jgi:hypothetical protein